MKGGRWKGGKKLKGVARHRAYNGMISTTRYIKRGILNAANIDAGFRTAMLLSWNVYTTRKAYIEPMKNKATKVVLLDGHFPDNRHGK